MDLLLDIGESFQTNVLAETYLMNYGTPIAADRVYLLLVRKCMSKWTSTSGRTIRCTSKLIAMIFTEEYLLTSIEEYSLTYYLTNCI